MALFPKKQQPDIAPRRRQTSASAPNERATDESLTERYAFRRNRTLTGSASAQVSSVSESNAQLKSSRVQAHDLTRQRRRIGSVLGLTLLVVGVLFGLVWQFTAQPVVRTSDISQSLDPSYTKAVDEYLSRHPIERLRFLLHEDSLSTYVQSVTPEVASIKADGSAGFGKSIFTITMRQPIAGWSIRGVQQYVDASGTSFLHNHFATPAVQIVDNSGIQVEAGQAVASNQFLGFVGRVVGLSNAQGHAVTQVVIPQNTTRQIELRMQDTAYPIKLSIDRPAGEQVEDMSRALGWLKSHSVTPSYLDVRVSGRAFYK
jgi:hypothetical protein